MAFGEAQLDYVRRLADHIAHDLAYPEDDSGGNGSSDEERAELGGRPVAVGILGSDVYDKLLVLEALRDRLPRATFFTTDLDARLSHPDLYRRTRNLIVGSAYGLTVGGPEGCCFQGFLSDRNVSRGDARPSCRQERRTSGRRNCAACTSL